MVEGLAPGVRVLLPTGNVVRLVQREDTEWLCEYTENARARGSVTYTEKFLQTHAKIL